MSLMPASDPPLRSLSTRNLLGRTVSSFSLLLEKHEPNPAALEIKDLLAPLPPLATYPTLDRADKLSLFHKKLKAGHPIIDIEGPLFECKTKVLMEILTHVRSPGSILPEIQPEFTKFVEVNIFRTLQRTVIPEQAEFDPEEDCLPEDAPELDEDTLWSHRSIVYDILVEAIMSPDVDAGSNRSGFNSSHFVNGLLGLLDSEDPRERTCVRSALHCIYSRFTRSRGDIRRELGRFLTTAATSGFIHFGIFEILEIMGSVIKGYIVPLKEEHKHFLREGLLPLHRLSYLKMFHAHLAFCVVQFVSKDNELAGVVVPGILKRLPRGNSVAVVLLLSEVEAVVTLAPPKTFAAFAPELLKVIAKYLVSQNNQIIEKCVSFLSNPQVMALMATDGQLQARLKVVFPGLRAAAAHWNKKISASVGNFLKHLASTQPTIFRALESSCPTPQEMAAARAATLRDSEARWQNLLAALKASRKPLPTIRAAWPSGMREPLNKRIGSWVPKPVPLPSPPSVVTPSVSAVSVSPAQYNSLSSSTDSVTVLVVPSTDQYSSPPVTRTPISRESSREKQPSLSRGGAASPAPSDTSATGRKSTVDSDGGSAGSSISPGTIIQGKLRRRSMEMKVPVPVALPAPTTVPTSRSSMKRSSDPSTPSGASSASGGPGSSAGTDGVILQGALRRRSVDRTRSMTGGPLSPSRHSSITSDDSDGA